MDNMDVIKRLREGKYLNILEEYHIYRISKDNLHMNNILYVDIYSPTLDTLYEL
jgi:hypothetical protein